jgi:hypothetical protein
MARHRVPTAALALLLLSMACGCTATAPSASRASPAAAIGLGSRNALPSAGPTSGPCGGSVTDDRAHPPTPVLFFAEASSPGTMGLAHRWVEGGEVANGEGVYPRPGDIPALPMTADAELRLVSPAEAKFAASRIVGLVASLWPGPSDEAVVLADSSIGDGGPSTAVCFSAPPPGDWMIQARLDYADRRGNASFFWHLRVA